MQAGRLRHPITIQAPVKTANTTGETRKQWSDVASRRAHIEPLSGRELWQARQTDATVSHRVTMRADRSLSIVPQMRVKFGTRVFDINAALTVDEIHHEQVLYCTEVV